MKKKLHTLWVCLSIFFSLISVHIHCMKHFYRIDARKKKLCKMPQKRRRKRENRNFLYKKIRQQQAARKANQLHDIRHLIKKGIRRLKRKSVPLNDAALSKKTISTISDVSKKSILSQIIMLFLSLFTHAKRIGTSTDKSFTVTFNHCFLLSEQYIFAKAYSERQASYQCSHVSCENDISKANNTGFFCNFYPLDYEFPGEPCAITIDESTLYDSFFRHNYDYWVYYLFAREMNGHEGIVSDCESSVDYFMRHFFCDNGISCKEELVDRIMELVSENHFYKHEPKVWPIQKMMDDAGMKYLHPQDDLHCQK